MSTTSVRLLAETDFAWCADKYIHIWDGVQKLSAADHRLGVTVELGGVEARIAAKKAHTYARRFGMKLMCKTRVGKSGQQLFIRRRLDTIIVTPRRKSEAKTFKEFRLEMGYSCNCSDGYHNKCAGFRNVNHSRRAECHCPCHEKRESL